MLFLHEAPFQFQCWCQFIIFRRQQYVDQAKILNLLNAGEVLVLLEPEHSETTKTTEIARVIFKLSP